MRHTNRLATLPPSTHTAGRAADEPRAPGVLERLSRLGSWTTHRDAWLAELDRLIDGHEVPAANDDAVEGPGG